VVVASRRGLRVLLEMERGEGGSELALVLGLLARLAVTQIHESINSEFPTFPREVLRQNGRALPWFQSVEKATRFVSATHESTPLEDGH
jgi:hypothetical protein